MPLLSLAAGALPEFAPDAIVGAAAEAGFAATGIWCDTERWTAATTRAVSQRLREGALVPLDIEVIWIQPGRNVGRAAREVIDIGAELGARNVLIVSANDNAGNTRHQFEVLCELADAAGMRAVLEFLMIAQVKTLAEAVAIVSDVAHPAGGVLIDPLHLQRCGASAAEVAMLEPDLLPYAQFCDAAAQLEKPDYEAYLADALDGRSAPGEGELPLRELLDALPAALPLSLEVRSRKYRDQYPDPVARARAILAATERFFAIHSPPPRHR